MERDMPELTSFGTLLKFARNLEETLALLTTRAAARPDCGTLAGELGRSARRHEKRAQQLERYQRERLNEVVLQPIEGMRRGDYDPLFELPQGEGLALPALAEQERIAARFYRDAVDKAAHVLEGLDRTFSKYGKESEGLASKLGG